MAENMKVSLTVEGKDANAKATIDSAKASLDGLNRSVDQNAAASGRAKTTQDALSASFAQGTAAASAFDAATATTATTLGQVAEKQAAYAAALRAGVVNQSEYDAASRKLEATGARLFSQFDKSTPQLRDFGKAAEGAALNVAGLQREAGVLAGELARGNTAAFEKSLVTLARQSGVLAMAFTGTGAAVAAGVAVIVGAVALLEASASRIDNFNRALFLTGNAAQTNAGQLEKYSLEIGASTGRYSEATDALTKLAETGKFVDGNLATAAQGVVAFADLTGRSIDSAVQQFEKLADDPYKASVKLNDSLGVLSVALADEIRQLEESGDKAGAAALATSAFADALSDREAEYRASLTGFSALWRDVGTEIQKATRYVGDFLNKNVQGSRQNPGSSLAGLLLGGATFGGTLGFLSTQKQDFSNVTGGDASEAAQRAAAKAAIDATAAMSGETEQLKKLADAHDLTKVAATANAIQERLLKAGSDEEADAILREGDYQLQLAAKVDASTAAKKKHATTTQEAGAIESMFFADIQRGLQVADDYAETFGGKVDPVTKQYEASLKSLGTAQDEVQALMAAGIGDQEKLRAEWDRLSDGAAALGEATDLLRQKQELLRGIQSGDANAVQDLEAKWAEESAALRNGADSYDYATERIKYHNQALAAYAEAVKNAHTQQDLDWLSAHKSALLADADAAAAETVAIKKSAEEMKAWQEIGKQAGDTLANGIGDAVAQATFNFKSMSDLFHSIGETMKNTAQQIVAAIISQFVKLAVINPILNAIFGGTGGWSALGTLGGGTASLITGGAALLAGGSSDSGSFNMGGPSGGNSAISTGTNLLGAARGVQSIYNGGLSGVTNGISNFWNGTSGVSGYTGTFNMGGPSGVGYNPQYGGYGSGFGQALGIAGGAYAGYNEYQRAGGGAAGLVGGAAYGVGTYALGAGVASAAASTGFAAGVGGAVGAVPVIGWVALAAMVVDMISGGKLFGTKGKFNFGEQTLSTSASGATVSAGYDLKGQKPLFGGSTHKWVSTDPGQAAVDAANAFFDAVSKGNEQFAKDLGTKAGEVAAGTFTQTFDKHGNVTKTSDTIAGHTYTGESGDDFQQRVVDETEINTLSAFDANLSTSIDKYRANVQSLTAVVDALAGAQVAFNGGMKLLALGTDQSISHLLSWSEANEKFGESVDQTIQRVEQAQSAYDQFVAAFKPVTTYADAFQASLGGIRDEYKANIKQANDLAKAAGAQGASEEDLENIRKHSIAELKQLQTQLEQQNQALAVDLGYTNQGATPDQIQQQIDAIRNGADEGTSAVTNFGNAMHVAAQRATDAMNLLLGDLSPLTDIQKLQAGLAGLHNGTATADQVLTIGRRLYGSSQQYTDLFNQVKPFAGAPTGGGSTGGGSTGSGNHPLTAADQARISQLEQQKKDAENVARHNEALALAQGIANLSIITGQSYEDIAKSEGYDLEKLEKDLGVTSIDQVKSIIDGYKAQQDSAHEDSLSILGELRAGFDRVVVALGGTAIGNGSTPFGPDAQVGQFTGTPPAIVTPGARGGGHSGHGRDGGALNDPDATGSQLANGFLRVVGNVAAAGERRNGRQSFQPSPR
jgi:hypothetical protein